MKSKLAEEISSSHVFIATGQQMATFLCYILIGIRQQQCKTRLFCRMGEGAKQGSGKSL